MDPKEESQAARDAVEDTDHKQGISRSAALKNTAKVGLAVGAAGLLGEGSLLSAMAATHDTKGDGKFTGWAGLSQGEVNVLRQVVVDPKFRVEFTKNPKSAIKQSGEKLTPDQITNLSRINKLQVDSFVSNVQASLTSGTAGTHTLIYAIVFAIVCALLLAVEGQEGSATAGGAVPIF